MTLRSSHFPAVAMKYICMLAAGFLAGGSRQEKASVRLPCSGKKLAANVSDVCDVAVFEK